MTPHPTRAIVEDALNRIESLNRCSMCELYEHRERQHRDKIAVLTVRMEASAKWQVWFWTGWAVAALVVLGMLSR